ncbi:uncharacterized protein Z520_00940 [Fonsecaea multimorphosa CBS 102226]|uniref:DUF7719 domain-containing protein n=1 Tax=Fonsecaea multimorphosa CBS 102226 TaxID=1442371 RepID=A0A0D2HQX3_9EURO|nr:uncharacterized protein Z520_00940 [Fonsecaea multimorphosa CBS 102226]KIY04246.1 hypothetical protein Z520_00940 [Fonsecaea multimorphosa CBS 102226]OAL31668.1 hypothetical protein AYO22_00941 [Fonsecaea multimorphosa]
MNRKQRRAKETATATARPTTINSADDIPLARPDRGTTTATTTTEQHGHDGNGNGRTKTKTLLEIAAERQAQLSGAGAKGIDARAIQPENIVQVKIGKRGEIIPESNSSVLSSSAQPQEPEEEYPWLDTLLLASSLSAVHFTLSVLAMHQYAEEVRFRPLIVQTVLVAFPTLSIFIALFHGHLFPPSLANIPASVKYWIVLLRSIIYVVTANVAGCYLIQLTNDKGYYAVMKDAPGVGTIWVWAVLEMGLLGALAGVAGPGIYAWWFGYGIW